MAKHLVKCPICNITFDANIESYIMMGRRYAHEDCFRKNEERKTQEEKDKAQLEAYIKELFSFDKLPPKVNNQIKQFKNEYHYSYSAIYKTLKYWFEIKHGQLERANGGIGIVPYIIDEARNYWLDILEAKELNKQLIQEKIELPITEIHISPPKRAPIRKFKKNFIFLEEDNE